MVNKYSSTRRKFLYSKKKNNSSCLSKVEIDKVNGIIITAPFEDHLHMESINMLSGIPIYTSNIVKKQLRLCRILTANKLLIFDNF